MELLYGETSSLILKAFYGFKNSLPLDLELSFFKNALIIEMEELGLSVQTDKSYVIEHKQQQIGVLKIDCIVNNQIAVKLVSTPLDISEESITSMKTFLRLTPFEVGLVLNFGSDGQHKRVLLTKDFKEKKG